MHRTDFVCGHVDAYTVESDENSDSPETFSGSAAEQPVLRRLPQSLVNRIAAGEVVERPASAVKELLENALDAKATRISVYVEGGGRNLIRVQDDGHGMSSRDLPLSVERHATSKLPKEDLVQIHDLGFRGEALASIGAVSRLQIVSRRRDTSSAYAICVAGGKVDDVRPTSAGFSSGTMVEIGDLFFATPARLKFLRSERSESEAIEDIVRRLAIAWAEVTFRLQIEGRRPRVFQVQASGQDRCAEQAGKQIEVPESASTFARCLRFRVGEVLGKDFLENALPILAVREDCRLSGFVSLPTWSRARNMMQYIFVNRRPLHDRMLSGVLRAAYGDLIAQGRFPAAALFLELDSRLVDVNVHPAKTEVRFRHPERVRSLLITSVRHALAEAGHRVAESSHRVATSFRSSFSPARSSDTSQVQPVDSVRRAHDVRALPAPQAPLRGRFAPQENFSSTKDATPNPAPPEQIPLDDTLVQESDRPLGVAVAQVYDTYILSQTATGIILVDQHAAHERLMYEKVKEQLLGKGVRRQGLLIPEVVEMEESLVRRLHDKAEVLARLGLAFEQFGAGALLIRETPAILGSVDVQALLRDLSDCVLEADAKQLLEEKLFAVCSVFACHRSIRAGRQMNHEEMNALLREMERSAFSGQCNHGRPSWISLKKEDLEKLFGRR